MEDPKIAAMDVHFQGIFERYPIKYSGGVTQRMEDIDLAAMDRVGCFAFFARFTGESVVKVFYCLPDVDFPHGLREVVTDVDYQKFVALVYECGCWVQVYLDHFGTMELKAWLEGDNDFQTDDGNQNSEESSGPPEYHGPFGDSDCDDYT